MTTTQPQTRGRGRRNHSSKPTQDVIVVGGQKFKLADLPLVAFIKTCGHPGRDFAVQAGDLVFCDTCREHTNVARITA
jgi:hypothetical protein